MVVKHTHVRAEQTPGVMAARARSSLVSPRSESLLLRLLSALLSVVLLRVLVIPAPLVLALSRRTPCLRELSDGYFNRSEPNFTHMCHTLLYSCAFLQPVNGTVSMWACRCAGAVGWPRRQRCQRSSFCSGGDGAVLRSLTPSASCDFGFPGVLAGRFAPYSSADGSVSPPSDGFKWADLLGPGAGRCQKAAREKAAGRRSMRPSQEHVVSVLRLLMLELSVAYRSPQGMHDVWSVLLWGSGCSAGGIAGTGSALVYDLSLSAELRHVMRCLLIAHVFRHSVLHARRRRT